MKKLILSAGLLITSSAAWAAGPIYTHDPPIVQREYEEVYRSITFPEIINGSASTMTVTYLNASSITLNGVNLTVPVAAKVIQIVQGTTTVHGSSTSSTYADTGLTATIVPTSASNKVLVFVSQACEASVTGAQTIAVGGLRILRAGSAIYTSDGAFGYNRTTVTLSNDYMNVGLIYLDSPATTSSTIYKTQYNREAGADGTVHVQPSADGATYSSITLVEVTP